MLNSNAKQASKNKQFELPLLSNRSSSKPTLIQQRNQLTLAKETTNSAKATFVGIKATTQSHNLLPSRIGCGISA